MLSVLSFPLWCLSSAKFWQINFALAAFSMLRKLYEFDWTNWIWVSQALLLSFPGGTWEEITAQKLTKAGKVLFFWSEVCSSSNSFVFANKTSSSGKIKKQCLKFKSRDGAATVKNQKIMENLSQEKFRIQWFFCGKESRIQWIFSTKKEVISKWLKFDPCFILLDDRVHSDLPKKVLSE